MAKFLIVLLLSYIMMSCANTQVSNNLPLSFVETEVALIASEIGKVRYTMRYSLSEDSPKTLYGKIQYQDLTNRQEFNSLFLGTINQASVVNYNSMPANQIVNQQLYSITLVLYDDADYKNAIGTHQDVIWFDMPKNVAQLLKIKLL